MANGIPLTYIKCIKSKKVKVALQQATKGLEGE
jgi:hypothetical protein